MKKSLIAVAALAAAGGAFAQSSVTLFGVVDTSVRQVKGAGNGSQTLLANSGLSSSRLGFRGVEDLGGGLSASFWLEAAIIPDDGRAGGTISANNQTNTVTAGSGLNFNRRSTVSLSGGFGEVRLGRNLTPAFNNFADYDPFGTVGVGSSTNIIQGLSTAAGVTTAVRASNMIMYFLPSNLGGFYGSVAYALGENASNAGITKNDGRHIGARFGYAAGPINVGLGYGETRLKATLPAGTTLGGVSVAGLSLDKYRMINLGASWDFGVAKAIAVIAREEVGQGSGRVKSNAWQLGAFVPVGVGEIHASLARAKIDLAGPDPRGTQIAVGYQHNLSKRTALYGTYARISNKSNGNLFFNNGRAATNTNGSTQGYEIGVRHSF